MSAPIRLGQKGMHKSVECVGISYVNIVLALGEYVKPRAGYGVMDCLSMQTWCQRILGAMQHKSWAFHLRKKWLVKITARIEQRFLAGDIALPQILKRIAIDVAHRFSSARRPGGDLADIVEGRNLSCRQVGLAAEYDQLRNPFRLSGRHDNRDIAAIAPANDAEPLVAQGRHKREHVG